MISGICKLCLKKKPLQRSHLIPAAVTRTLRGSGYLSPGPVAMTKTVIRAGVPDIRAYLLCRDCEQRFSRNGESWVLKRICRDGRFPLLDRLKLAIPIGEENGRLRFSGPQVGVLTEKLAYFAVSMLWRSVALPWASHDQSRKSTYIGSLQEECRKYLLGQSGFPRNLWVLAVACSDPISQHSAHELAEMEVPFTAYSFLMCGLFLVLLIGGDVPQEERDRCCVTSALRPIFVEDRSSQNFNAILRIQKTARLTKTIEDGMRRFKLRRPK
jgi:hypothetical protein